MGEGVNGNVDMRRQGEGGGVAVNVHHFQRSLQVILSPSSFFKH